MVRCLLWNFKKGIIMNEEQLKELELKVKKAKFKLSQKASELHDLIEDRLPVDYLEIPAYAEATFNACKEWDELNKQLIKEKNN